MTSLGCARKSATNHLRIRVTARKTPAPDAQPWNSARPLPLTRAGSCFRYLSAQIETLAEELKNEGCVAASWGLEKTIAGLKTARAFLTGEMLKRCTVTKAAKKKGTKAS